MAEGQRNASLKRSKDSHIRAKSSRYIGKGTLQKEKKNTHVHEQHVIKRQNENDN